MGALKEMGVWSGDDGQGSSVCWGDRGAWKLVYGALWLCPSPLISSELMFLAFFPEILSGSMGVGAFASQEGKVSHSLEVVWLFVESKAYKSQMQGQRSSLSPAVIYLLLHALQHDQLRSLVGTVLRRHLPGFGFCGNPVALGCEWLPACGTEPASRGACGRG